MHRQASAPARSAHATRSSAAGCAAIVAVALLTQATPARADDASVADPPVLLAQAPPPGYYPPPPGYYPPPPGYYPRRPRYYAPAPPPAPYNPFYFDLGVTAGVPLLFSSDIDGAGNPGAAIGAGLGLHVSLGLNVGYSLGLGLDLAAEGYDLSNGRAGGLGHADLGLVGHEFRGGLGLAAFGDGVGVDAYLGHFWRIGGPWNFGLSGDLMWNANTGDAYLLINLEVGVEFGNR